MSMFIYFLLYIHLLFPNFFFFFFNDTATTEIYTLSLHDALPIWIIVWDRENVPPLPDVLPRKETPLYLQVMWGILPITTDRKSTRLNSSHGYISYAVFCLKKKKKPST